MARKNNSSAEASGSIHFDARTRTVMAEASHENIKEKVQSVREVVLGKSNNEVVMVLQYYDYSVEKAIQAYLEDGAKAALQEWNFTGSKQPNKKRKNKKKANNDKTTDKVIPTSATPEVENKENAVNGENPIPNGHLPSNLESLETDSSQDSPSTKHSQEDSRSTDVSNNAKKTSSSNDSSSTSTAAALPQRQQHGRGHGRSGGADSHNAHHHTGHALKQRERTVSEMSSTSSAAGDGHSRKPLHGLEKAFKDLQRQTTSLERLRLLLDSEIERSYKSVKNVFEELRSGLNQREEKLLAEMDMLKKEALEMLESRQHKAGELKMQAERADRLKESEVTELRSEIKHFVAERRHDEEMGRTTRFLYDSDHMMEEIDKFGEVVHVTKSKNATRRPSISSVASSAISHDDNLEDDLSHSREVTELQDRLKSSLGLQDSDSRPSTQNGSSSSENKVEDYSSYRNFRGRSSGYRNQNKGENANSNKSPQLSSSSPSPPSADGHRGRGGRGGGGSRGRGRGHGGQRGRGRGYGNTGQNQRPPSASQGQGAASGHNTQGTSSKS